MPVSEFELIARHFAGHDSHPGVLLGVGDDAALLLPPGPGEVLAVTVDALVSGVHFDPDVEPDSLGHKTLAVNLSDLAAMGATPAWFTLALTLPGIDEAWVGRFARGLASLAEAHGVALVGGDTTRGPLAVTIQAAGHVPAGEALRRDGARPGDAVCVTGTLGDAALALRDPPDLAAGDRDALRERLLRPTPRLAAGRALRGLATAAIDLSDGLAADLGHVLEASGVGATLELAMLPLTAPLQRRAEAGDWTLPLGGGDDYELCFTLPEARLEALASRDLGVGWRRIGTVDAGSGLRLHKPDGTEYELAEGGYDHFRETP